MTVVTVLRRNNGKKQEYFFFLSSLPTHISARGGLITFVSLHWSGLETLGLFRPWRFAEVPHTVARTLALFLRAVYPDDNVPLEDKDLLGFVNLTNDHALDAFRDALQHAGIHNVVACLKWVS